MRRGVISVATAAVSVFALVGVFSCEQEDVLLPDRNLPPETIVTEAPAESTQTNFKVHMFWYGRDADGIVTRFRYAVDDTVEPGSWHHTTRTDTTFIFTANDPLLRYHEFFIAAIDNENKADPTPAALRFFARDDFMPEVWMLDAPVCSLSATGDTVACLPLPAGVDTLRMDDARPVLFAWDGRDRDGTIVAFAYKLDNEGYQWVDPDVKSVIYPAPKFLMSGAHSFYIKARDDAWAEMSPSLRYRFVVNLDPNSVIDSLYYIPYQSSDRFPLDFSTGSVADTLPDGSSIEFVWHGTDVDGEVRKSLVLLRGPDLLAQQEWSTGWMDYPDSTRFQSVVLRGTLQGPFVLNLFSLDDRKRAEGTPAVVEFLVNFPPVVSTPVVAVADSVVLSGGVPVDTLCVATFIWSATDEDNNIGAPVRFFYKIDGRLILPSTSNSMRTSWSTTVSSGVHVFEVFAYNYSYDPRVRTRSSSVDFEVSESCGLVKR